MIGFSSLRTDFLVTLGLLNWVSLECTSYNNNLEWPGVFLDKGILVVSFA